MLGSSSGDADWRLLSPLQRAVQAVGLALAIAVLLGWGLTGLVYGWLHVFMLEAGFVAVSGRSMECIVGACVALALASASALVERHSWRWGSDAAWHRRVRRRLFWLAAALGVLCLAFDLWPGEAGAQLRRARGWAPEAVWPLMPLPLAAPWLIDFAGQPYVGRALLGGVGLALVSLLLFKLEWQRAGLACLGTALCILGGYWVGDAALDFVAAREPARFLGGAESAAVLRAEPGRYNAGVFTQWWGGLGSFALGWLLAVVAVRSPARVRAGASRI